MDPRDRVAAVTGGAGGIGAALARALHSAGARTVAVLDIDGDGAAAVAGQIGGWSRRVDVSDEADLVAAIDEAEAELGPIDIFCSNAGILVVGGPEVPTADWQRIWDINVSAHIWAARRLIPAMLERGGGHLVNTASAAGLLTQIGSAPYAVTKAAAVSFAEWLAITYGDGGLEVSVLCPQAVRTAMTDGVPGGGVAGVDGMMEPDAVAAIAIAAMRAGAFLVLPHPEVAEYARRKGDDRERWIAGMRRLATRFDL